MFWEPWVSRCNPAYDFIVNQLASGRPFIFSKLNHGFWERLEVIESLGYRLDNLSELSDEQVVQLESRIGAQGTFFIAEGFLTELLDLFRTYDDRSSNFYFAPSLHPWPLSDRIEGTPLRPAAGCRLLIGRYVSRKLLEKSEKLGLSGYEFKQAIINGELPGFLSALEHRNLVVLCNAQNRALFDSLSFDDIKFVEVHEREARNHRYELLAKVKDLLVGEAAKPPVVIAMIGGALATWLGFELNRAKAFCQFVDIGAAFYAFSENGALQRNWMKAYQHQLSAAVHSMNLPKSLTRYYPRDAGYRNAMLIEMARNRGVPEPKASAYSPTAEYIEVPGFLENKHYDVHRLSQYLSLSVNVNRHANYGPVVQLLEEIVHNLLALPSDRHVVAVNSGTSALHIATALNHILSGAKEFRWVTSRFSFFSAACGSLAKPLFVDCDAIGRLDFQQLDLVPKEQYDGVVYTNVFSQNSDWEPLYQWCKRNGKRMVVDNATGLLDRPSINREKDAPIEIVSCHHTKPWGVGEGGFLICNEEEAPIARKLANFGVGLGEWSWLGSNYKLSDLAAAAIIDRLETLDQWRPFYQWQERRVKSLVVDSELSLVPLKGRTDSLSPRAYTPFVAPNEVRIVSDGYPLLFRKYYKPLGGSNMEPALSSQANRLYRRIVCISNNPFNRALSNETYLTLMKSALKICSGC